MQLAAVTIGNAVPAWISGLPDGLTEEFSVAPHAVEAGLNQALARTRAEFFLPVDAADRLEPTGVAALLEGLRRASGAAVAAVAPAEQVRRDGGLRQTPATPAGSRQALLALRRIATPVLFRTGALRQAGGWRPGEAGWSRRAFRHRGLLARLLEQGRRLIAVNHPLGIVALPGPATPDLPALLAQLLYRRVRITGRSPRYRAEGRIAAVTPAMVTLAGEDGRVILLSLERVVTVAVAEAGPHKAALSPVPIPPGARIVTRVWGPKWPSWPSL